MSTRADVSVSGGVRALIMSARGEVDFEVIHDEHVVEISTYPGWIS